jgi:hypothetical protein
VWECGGVGVWGRGSMGEAEHPRSLPYRHTPTLPYPHIPNPHTPNPHTLPILLSSTDYRYCVVLGEDCMPRETEKGNEA